MSRAYSELGFRELRSGTVKVGLRTSGVLSATVFVLVAVAATGTGCRSSPGGSTPEASTTGVQQANKEEPAAAGTSASVTGLEAAVTQAEPVASVPPSVEADSAACQAGDGEACFRMGERASINKDTPGERRYYVAACDAGIGLACVHLGNGVEGDESKRPGWLAKGFAAFATGCEKNDAQSCYYKGISLERGIGTAEDHRASIKAYDQGCELGSAESCTNGAGMHSMGKGTAKDDVRAAQLYAHACQKGDAFGCYHLGRLHEGELGILGDTSHTQKLRSESLGVEARVNDSNRPAQASPAKRGPTINLLLRLPMAELTAACEAKDGLACYQLGVMHQVGGGAIKKDDAKAVAFYESACNSGNAWGCFRAGDCYQRGHGVSPDFKKATSFWKRVCEGEMPLGGGFKDECWNLGERMGMGPAPTPRPE